MCRTELTSCCRDEDNVNGGPQGEWYGPDGNKIPSVSDSQGFFISRNLSSVNLNRRVGTSQPVGSFCCVIPSAGDINETFCAAIEGWSCLLLSLSIFKLLIMCFNTRTNSLACWRCRSSCWNCPGHYSHHRGHCRNHRSCPDC